MNRRVGAKEEKWEVGKGGRKGEGRRRVLLIGSRRTRRRDVQGVVSKKDIGAGKTRYSMASWRILAAFNIVFLVTIKD